VQGLGIVLRSLFGAALLLACLAPQALATSSSAQTTVAPSTPQSIATYCPRPLHRATRLIVVTVPAMTSVKGTLHMFERKTPASASWQRSGSPETVVVGAAGIGWAEDFDYLARKDEPVKREGDRRTPAGIFRVAGPFGFGENNLPGYTRLEAGRSFCVDDPTSILYGKIVSKQLAAKVKSTEDMSTVPGLKRALMVDYPARRGAKAGSCIFVHVWDGANQGTNARIGMPEDRVAVLQEWSSKGFTAIAVTSEDAALRFKSCLPSNTVSRGGETPALPLRKPRAEGRRADLGR
jgi:L,D-peptidoglycan transpeptidase YkuD (ErfK/YbiS/YcfS/YnhG family)